MADIYFHCAGCGKSLAADERAAGQSLACVDCGQTLTVPPADREITCACGTRLLIPKAPRPSYRCLQCGTDVPTDPLGPVRPAAEHTAEKPRLRREGGDGPTCPRCGKPLSADAALCTACGYDLRTGRQYNAKPPRPRRNLPSWRVLARTAALLALLILIFLNREGVSRLFDRVGALARRQYYAWTFKKQQPSEGAALCTLCQGAGRVKCPTCGGFGTVEVQVRIPCDQCGGTGKYKKKLGGSSSSGPVCPFCRGRGYNPRSSQEPCGACEGTGLTPCSGCAGTGRRKPAAQ